MIENGAVNPAHSAPGNALRYVTLDLHKRL
jgi:hypothetical protein